MSKTSRDSDQVFVVWMGTRNGADANNEGGNLFLGAFAIAIVLMVFVGLLNEADRQRMRDWNTQPTQQNGQFTHFPTHPSL